MDNHINSIQIHSDKYPCRTHYPFTLPLFYKTREIRFKSPVTIFVGENGTGKSTLLEAIARACDIHIWCSESGQRYKSNRYEKLLYRYIQVGWGGKSVPGAYFGSENFNDFRKIVDSWASTDPGQLKYFGGDSLVTQSHGQSIMAYFKSRYGIKGLYFLDEPETALSPKSQMELLEIIQEAMKGGHAQFIIATHSPILMAVQDAEILSFDGEKVSALAYKDTPHFNLYRDFLNGR